MPDTIPEPLVDELIRVARRLWERGFLEATSGNLSVKIREAPTRILITATGVDKATLKREDFVIVDGSGVPVGTDTRRPSQETRLHVKIYAVVPAVTAVIHAHPPYSIALTQKARKNVISFKGLAMARAFPGVEDVAEANLKMPVVAHDRDVDRMATTALAQRKGLVPAVGFVGHGIAAWGMTLSDALRHVEAVEAMCRVLVLEKAMG